MVALLLAVLFFAMCFMPRRPRIQIKIEDLVLDPLPLKQMSAIELLYSRHPIAAPLVEAERTQRMTSSSTSKPARGRPITVGALAKHAAQFGKAYAGELGESPSTEKKPEISTSGSEQGKMPKDCEELVRPYVAAYLVDPSSRPKHYSTAILNSLPHGTPIFVGAFERRHPNDSEDLVLPDLASFDLIPVARNYLEMMNRSDIQATMKISSDFRVADNDIYVAIRRYEMFMRFQNDHPDKVIVPPSDVLCIWLCHVIRNKDPALLQYEDMCTQLLGRVLPLYLAFSPSQRAEAGVGTLDEEASRRLWERRYPSEPFGGARSKIDFTVRLAHYSSLSSHDIGQDVAWLPEFVKSIGGDLSKLADDKVMRALLKHYERFLYLCAKYPKRNLNPPSPIDVIWHAHQCLGEHYHRDMNRVMRTKLMHQPWPIKGDEIRTLCKDLWTKEFPDVPFPCVI